MSEKYSWLASGTLRRRGWTDNMIRELLPAPKWRYMGNRRVRMWAAADVEAAEQTENFARMRSETPEEPSGSTVEVCEWLQAAWLRLPPPEKLEETLALRWHDAILQQLRRGGALGVRPGKAMSYVEDFLHLEKEGDGEKLASVLRRFLLSAVWIGQNRSHPRVQTLLERYRPTITAFAARQAALLRETAPEADLEGLLAMDPFPYPELLGNPLTYVYSVCYVPRAIRSSLGVLMALNPRDEYPEARAIRRHFILHLGGTNTGKTYAGFQRLKQASTGVYLAPLRLLALEAQEVLLQAGVACSLTTGEEEDVRDGDTHVAATAEKLSLSEQYEVAVIDECQMLADDERGYAWTRAILGVQSPEIHLCAAPQAKDLLIRIIRSCSETFEIVEHERKTPLVCMNRTVDYDGIQPGDALITFSKVGVLSTAEDLRRRGKEPAIIYGALPYSTRRKQVQGFLDGQMQYVVATDAIGMGLNLPIRRVIFMETEKFDGKERRELKPEEIQQIAGRAGRFGMYDKGFVGAMENLGTIRAGMETVVPPLTQAVVGFSDLVLQVEFDLLEVLEVWNRMPTVEPYRKLDVSRYITIISRLREWGFRLSPTQELRAANIPYDETDPGLNDLFRSFLKVWNEYETPEMPRQAEKPENEYTLPELEDYCRRLDLYFSFCKAFSCPVDRDGLFEQREAAALRINTILLHNLKNNIRFCPRCGAALPLHSTGRLCSACFRKLRCMTGGAYGRHKSGGFGHGG